VCDREIVYVIGDLDVGGCQQHLLQLLPRLRERGIRPVVYCVTHKGALAAAMEAAGIEVRTHPLGGSRRLPRALRRSVVLPVTVVTLCLLLLTRRPAAVHCFLPAAYLIGAPCAVLTRVPFRLMSRRSLNHYQAGRSLLARFERWLHRHMQALLGNSRAVVGQLREEGAPGDRLGLIHNGVDCRQFHPVAPEYRVALRRRVGLGPGNLVLLMVANLIPYKGHADLLAALAEISDRLPAAWVLLLVGRDDGIGKVLQARARAFGIGGRVRFLGSRGDVAELMQLADIGVLPSHQEGFSNTVLEAMASSLPVVVTEVGGNPEAIEDGVTGLIVPLGDRVALGEALIRLAYDPALRARLGRTARERVEKHFSIDECVRKYGYLYGSLFGGAGMPKLNGGDAIVKSDGSTGG